MKSYELAIILPSRNEADSIDEVTARVDRGLGYLGLREQSILINADNSEGPETRAAFKATPTQAAKQSLAVNGLGKGDNVLAGIRYGLACGVNRFCMFDTDLTSFDPMWVDAFLSELHAGAAVVTPVYGRKWVEGGTTNHCMAPILYGMTGRWMAQPIAGDFAFTADHARHIARRPFTDDQRRYGIDILLTATALFEGRKVGQIALKEKVHKPSFDKTKDTYMGAASVLFDIIRQRQVRPAQVKDDDMVAVHLLDAPPILPAKLQARREEAHELLRQVGVGEPPSRLDGAAWVAILERHISQAHAGHDGHQVAAALLPWFFLRTVTFLSETPDASAAEAVIARQAYMLRHRLLAGIEF